MAGNEAGRRTLTSSSSLPSQWLPRFSTSSNAGHGICGRPRLLTVAGTLLGAAVISNAIAMLLFQGGSHTQEANLGYPCNALTYSSDYQRIELMIQIALKSEAQRLAGHVGADIAEQVLESTKEKLKEMMVNATRELRDVENVASKSKPCTCPDVAVETNTVYMDSAPLFPSDRVSDYVVAMARVPKDDFANAFSKQLGVPFEPSFGNHRDILLLYDKANALPNDSSSFYSRSDNKGERVVDTIPLIDSPEQATENCDQLNIVLTQPGNNRRQCVAILPEYESFYVQKLMRTETNSFGKKIAVTNVSVPFQYVSRYQRLGDQEELYPIPQSDETKRHWSMLQKYFASVDIVLDELRAILSKIAINNTLIVMVSNYGHSALLSNFICSAHARNHDISNLIVFATDQETADLVASYPSVFMYFTPIDRDLTLPLSSFLRRRIDRMNDASSLNLSNSD
jgi:hypothetical protein